MKIAQLSISLFFLLAFSSCKKQAAGAFYSSESGNVKIEVTGSQYPFDPWLVTVNVVVNEKSLYELSGMEVYASAIDSNTVSFDWVDNSCTINIQQMDGSVYPIPIIKLPIK